MLRLAYRACSYLIWALLLALAVSVSGGLPLPWELPTWVYEARTGLAVALLVCFLGKLLYDTLFYDHYRP